MTTACLGKWEYENHPEIWATVIKAEKLNLVAMMAADHAAFRIKTSQFWARAVGHTWVRTPKRLATTRVLRFTAQGLPPETPPAKKTP